MASFLPPPSTVDGVTLEESAAGVISTTEAARTDHLLLPGDGTGVTVTVLYYGNGTGSTIETPSQHYVPFAGTITRFGFGHTVVAGDTGSWALRVNGVDQATGTFTTTGITNATGLAIPVAAGDRVTFSLVRTAGVNSITFRGGVATVVRTA